MLVSITFANRTALVGTHAVQIQRGAECSGQTPVIAALSDLVISPAGVSVYNLSTPASVSLAVLLGSSFLIYAEGGDTPGKPVACGVIQGQRAASDSASAVVIGLLGGLLLVGGVVLRRGA